MDVLILQLCALLLVAGSSVFTFATAQCTIPLDCSDHATTVNLFPNGTCNCTCRNSWTDTQCQRCPIQFSQPSDCNSCNTPDYKGVFPNCTDDRCTAADCFFHASTVPTGFRSDGSCNCTCRNNWQPPNCNVCPAGFDQTTADCGACLDGYGPGYPTCRKLCTISANCSGHASNVSGFASDPTCACGCTGQWQGASCSTCPSIFKQTTCDDCGPGYGGYPTCVPVCTNSLNCNGRARFEPTGTPPGDCNCSCINQWTGAACQTCPDRLDPQSNCGACKSEYDEYPDCYLKCTRRDNCSQTGTSTATGNTRTGCTCNCKPNYIGSRCETCPEGFNQGSCVGCRQGYGGPSCLPICDVGLNCSGNAISVSGTFPACVCACRNAWLQPNCATCPANFSSTLDCGVCADGFGPSYPDCRRACTPALDCNGTNTLSSPGWAPACTCSCRNQFSGPRCDTCAFPLAGSLCDGCADGYDGYPSCSLKCDKLLNCSGRGQSVTGNALTGCNCICRNRWAAPTFCSACPTGFNASNDCSGCDTGYGGPVCQALCTPQADCFNHASNATGYRGSCSCTCLGAYTAASMCSTCPTPNYDNSNGLCNTCAAGYEGATCLRSCNVATDCTGHATTVTGTVGVCTCSCTGQWYPPSRCNLCPPRIDNSASGNCASCLTIYDNATFPQCTRQCNIAADCSDHASGVTGDVVGGCNCTCVNRWYGANCGLCPAQYDSSQNCGNCSATYEGTYPTCEPKCTSAADCFGRASSVSGVKGNCSCVCLNNFSSPSRCQLCPSPYAGASCDQCQSGYEEYPNCVATCTNANCSNRANSVGGNSRVGCSCICKNRWTGNSCQNCPFGFDAGRDCGDCSSGFVGYPNCSRSCTILDDCSNHSVFAGGDTYTGCRCDCRNAWSLSNCSVCPYGFNASDDCGSCADGFDGYPACALKCTVAANCSGHAVSVAGNARTGCECQCTNRWRGPTCSYCLPMYNQTTCSTCSESAQSFPACEYSCVVQNCPNAEQDSAVYGEEGTCVCYCRANASQSCGSGCANGYTGATCGWNWQCDIAKDCPGRAIAVNNTPSGCKCLCDGSWNGVSCTNCPQQYDPARNCSACNIGYAGVFPNCSLKCTNLANCSGHATLDGVVGTAVDGCSCSCRNAWYGQKCELCPANVDGGRDCGVCRTGYSGYPNCSRNCNVIDDCGNHAVSVQGNVASGCTCQCQNAYNGSTCEICAPIYDPGQQCGQCAVGFADYPTCSRKCTVIQDCNGRAGNVSGNIVSGCTCQCVNAWIGRSCDQCPVNVESTTCDRCVVGYEGTPPSCVRSCNVTTDCSGHGLNVTGDGSRGCTCQCTNSWTDSMCQTCPPAFNRSDNCFGCAAGFSGNYPDCSRTCTNMTDCNGNAAGVSGSTGQGCQCLCKWPWQGYACDDCPFGYDNGNDRCNTCAAGFAGFPYCERLCTNVTDCSGHAQSVTGILSANNSQCTCRCAGYWQGYSCNTCPGQYNPAGCNTCNEGWAGVPPTCVRLCNTIDDCSDHADSVTGDLSSGCNCSCSYKWYGQQCESCPARFNSAAACRSCADGFELYPNCYQKCTAIANCPAGRASNASGNVNSGCTCQCVGQWQGRLCDSCPINYEQTMCATCSAGFSGPNCSRVCTVAVDCGTGAAGANGTTTAPLGWSNSTLLGCGCQCFGKYAGVRCDVCPTGYDASKGCAQCASAYEGYPTCVLKCTIEANCSGHASGVTGNSATGCVCQCSGKWNLTDCSVCPKGFDPNGCDACAEGFDEEEYPRCLRSCTAQDCSYHSTAQSGNTLDGCTCVCRNQWRNNTCGYCPPQFDDTMNGDCGRCAPLFTGAVPDCFRPCDNQLDCNGHASTVAGNWSVCNCTCKNRWSGANCSVCAFPYEGGDCDRCADGYGGYPDCRLKCTVQSNCSSHATTVDGFQTDPSCSCSCRNFWGPASNCSVCPARYDESNDCLGCGADYIGQDCYLRCSPEYNCSARAIKVSQISPTECKCVCKAKWGGPTCSLCPDVYDPSDCESCANGTVGTYPECRFRTSTFTSTETTTSTQTLTGTSTGTGTNTSTTTETATGTQTVTNTSTTTATATSTATVTPTDTTTSTMTSTGTSTDTSTRSETTTTTTTGTATSTNSTTTTATLTVTPTASATTTTTVTTTGTGTNTTTVTTFAPPPTPTTTDSATLTATSTTAPTTRAPVTSCTVGADCNGHAVSVAMQPAVVTGTTSPTTSFPVPSPSTANVSVTESPASESPAMQCVCACRNAWRGAACEACPLGVDNSTASDCGKCTTGFEEYPRCVCVRHIVMERLVDVVDPNQITTTSPIGTPRSSPTVTVNTTAVSATNDTASLSTSTMSAPAVRKASRHAFGTLEVLSVAASSMNLSQVKDPVIQKQLRQSATMDLQRWLAAPNLTSLCFGVAGSSQGGGAAQGTFNATAFVYDASAVNATTLKLNVDIRIAADNATCGDIANVSECIAKQFRQGYCGNFALALPTVQSIFGTSTQLMCSLDLPSIAISRLSPCGDLGCGAAEDDGVTNTTIPPILAAPPDNAKIIGVIVGSVVALLLLLLVAIVFVRRRLAQRRIGDPAFMDGTKYTKGFDLETMKKDSELRNLAAEHDVFYEDVSKNIFRQVRGVSTIGSTDDGGSEMEEAQQLVGTRMQHGSDVEDLDLPPPRPLQEVKKIRAVTMTFI